MATSFTPKQLIEGMVVGTIDEETIYSNFRDAIDELTYNVMGVKAFNTQSIRELRSNNFTEIASDGTVPSAAKQVIGAGTFKENLVSMQPSMVIQDSILRDDFDSYGITDSDIASLSSLKVLPEAAVSAIFAKMSPFIQSLGRKTGLFLRGQTKTMLKNMGTASAEAWQKPMGLTAVGDATDRPNNWNYGNKLAVDCDTAGFKAGVKIFGGMQVDFDNGEVAQSEVVSVLHATDITLANDVLNPDKVSVTDQRTSADNVGIEGTRRTRNVATYGDTAHPDDFIMLGNYHLIRRLVLNAGDPLYKVVVEVDVAGIHVTVFVRSLMAIGSPVDIVKSIVEAA